MTTSPLAYPSGNHHPAGWVSAAEQERIERERVTLELAEEQEAADRAAREQAITERLTQRRAAGAVEDDGGEPELSRRPPSEPVPARRA